MKKLTNLRDNLSERSGDPVRSEEEAGKFDISTATKTLMH